MDLRNIEVRPVMVDDADRMRDGRFLVFDKDKGRLGVYRSNATLDADIPTSFRPGENVIVVAMSRASDRALLVNFDNKRMSVIDIKNQVEERSFTLDVPTMPYITEFGPNKTILMINYPCERTIKFIRDGESHIGGEIKAPHGNIILDISTDEDSCIFF